MRQGLTSVVPQVRTRNFSLAFRVLGAGNFPAHWTLCDFRALHLKKSEALFVQVLRLRRECGLVKLVTLYVLDEPTVGLHMADVEKLVVVLHRLVDAGNTVMVIEHNLDVMCEADWIVDLGPEGGTGGGRIVATGLPWFLEGDVRGSHTASAIKSFLASRPESTGGSC